MIGWRHTVEYGSLKLAFILLLFCEAHDLVWKIISLSEKRMKNCIVKIIDLVFEKNDEGGLFPLTRAVSHAGFSYTRHSSVPGTIYSYLASYRFTLPAS